MKIERLEMNMLDIAKYLRRDKRRLIKAKPITLLGGNVAWVIMHVEDL